MLGNVVANWWKRKRMKLFRKIVKYYSSAGAVCDPPSRWRGCVNLEVKIKYSLPSVTLDPKDPILYIMDKLIDCWPER